jgi:peroxiredoxin
VTVVGVAWSGTDDEFQAFVDEHGLTFPQLSDRSAAVFDRFDIPVQPALVVIDATGEVQTIHGSVDDQLLDQVFTTARS